MVLNLDSNGPFPTIYIQQIIFPADLSEFPLIVGILWTLRNFLCVEHLYVDNVSENQIKEPGIPAETFDEDANGEKKVTVSHCSNLRSNYPIDRCVEII